MVVTGGAGFLGSHVCERLIGEGHDVLCVDNLSTGSQDNIRPLMGNPAFEFRAADVSAGLDVDGPVAAVLHLACPASPRDYLRLSLETLLVCSAGTHHALELARAKDARFLLASTSEVYGDPAVHPQVETYWGNVNPVGPRAVYDEAKRFSEAMTVTYRSRFGVDTRIVRIFNTYGPRMRGGDGRMIPAFITQALAGKPLTVAGNGEQTRSLCYVDDTVRGLLALLASDQEVGPVNIGGSHELTVLDTAREVLRVTGSSSRVVFVPRPQDDPQVRRPDVSRAARTLGWRPTVDIGTGLRRTAEWFEGVRPVAAVTG
ncbi:MULTISPECIES: NAD-dependent epimerase/dehydratase family protein [Streptomycetaceae]|uniref:NAD-dependent epimerase/dehydratase family protein n=1 Tax=Streptomycetaceae TaxID=2062 RepID=UPI00300B794C